MQRISGNQLRVWVCFCGALLLAPLIFDSSFSISVLSQIGIATIACLSYNLLLGQGGMLSFGHAVYSGFGAFVAIRVLQAAGQGHWPVPVSLVPLAGGLAGLVLALGFGYVTTRKPGDTFAMITLGMGELMFALSIMATGFFGGEAGVSANRVVGLPVAGITFGPAIEVYYLIAVYTFVCTLLLYALCATPLGRMLEAVRDNPQRVAFVGYNPHRVRYTVFVISGFFAGISGGLAAINFELVTADVLGTARSGAYLLFTFIGGTGHFFGPIIGAVLMVLTQVLLSEWTKAWLLYLGLLFVVMVVLAPGGIASLIMANVRVASHRKLGRLLGHYLMLVLTGVTALAGAAALIEMVYHLQLSAALGSSLQFAGFSLDCANAGSWFGSAAVMLCGVALFEAARRSFVIAWATVQAELEHAHSTKGMQ
jgi:branched-chain amino acid transport system permease protein